MKLHFDVYCCFTKITGPRVQDLDWVLRFVCMDLNKLPPEFDFDFLDVESANPSYCTQLILDPAGLGGSQHLGRQRAQGDVGVTPVAFANVDRVDVDNQVAVLDMVKLDGMLTARMLL